MVATYGPLTAASRRGGGSNGSRRRGGRGRGSFFQKSLSSQIQQTVEGIKNWRHLRTFILCTFCLVVVLDSLLSPNLEPVMDFVRDNGNDNSFQDDELEDDERGFILDIEIQSLMEELNDGLLELGSEGFGGDDYDLNYITAQQRYERGIKATPNIDEGGNLIFHNLIDSKLPLPPYTIQDAIYASQIYYDSVAILVYDPIDDKFVLQYSQRHAWNMASRKLIATF